MHLQAVMSVTDCCCKDAARKGSRQEAQPASKTYSTRELCNTVSGGQRWQAGSPCQHTCIPDAHGCIHKGLAHYGRIAHGEGLLRQPRSLRVRFNTQHGTAWHSMPQRNTLPAKQVHESRPKGGASSCTTRPNSAVPGTPLAAARIASAAATHILHPSTAQHSASLCSLPSRPIVRVPRCSPRSCPSACKGLPPKGVFSTISPPPPAFSPPPKP